MKARAEWSTMKKRSEESRSGPLWRATRSKKRKEAERPPYFTGELAPEDVISCGLGSVY